MVGIVGYVSSFLTDLVVYDWLTSEVADIPFLVPIGLFLLSVSPEWVTVGFKDLYQVRITFPVRVLANPIAAL